ncbi:hypothetical protein MALGJ_45840 [Mycolicibacter algericus]|uniref:Uncharacterized protein n=2 Tax=Mycolicibacter algericus TaxID=1288388 RepID=A0A7I9YGW0_MYCAL|nr:hypothetical protein MALGJ_45840 [Mycolicibacter algericus]
MAMDFFLDRKSQRDLRAKLATVPQLVEDLAVTITRQAKIQPSGIGKLHRVKPESKLPYHVGAVDAADELHNALVTWVRFVCEHRQIRYTGREDMISLSAWLRRNMVPLALTPGSEDAGIDIAARIDACYRCVDLPPDDEIVIDRARVREANRSVVTLATIDPIACRLGEMGKGLNRDRLRLLARHGDIRPVGADSDTGTKFYRLGDVLHAHFARNRRGAK